MRNITQKEAREYYRELYDHNEKTYSIERIDNKDSPGTYILVIVDKNYETIDECIVRYTVDELLFREKENSKGSDTAWDSQ